jgi:predicted NAD/FAD-binding protein
MASKEWNMKIAVIGSGISGLLAARLLADEHEVHVFEANHYAGGHVHSVRLALSRRATSFCLSCQR